MIGVGNLFGYQVNRMVEGIVEISKRSSGDTFDIYLKLDGSHWYYFGYTREMMQIATSDDEFNNRLMKIPAKLRKSSEKRPSYIYMIASNDRVPKFLQLWQKTSEDAQKPSIMLHDSGVPASQQQQPQPQQPQPQNLPDNNVPVEIE